MCAAYEQNFDRQVNPWYCVGVDEETCEGMVAETCGRNNDRCEVLRCTGEPSLGLDCRPITIGRPDTALGVLKDLDPSNPAKDGYAITFLDDNIYKVLDIPEFVSKYEEEFAPTVSSITLKYSSPFIGDYRRSAKALERFCYLSSETCVELRIECFCMDYVNVFTIQRAIRNLPHLRSLYLEADTNDDGCVGHLFMMLRERVPNLRHLHLPKISMMGNYGMEPEPLQWQCNRVCQFVQWCQ